MTDKEYAKGNEIIMNFDGWKLETRYTFDPDHNGGKNEYKVYVKDSVISGQVTCRPEDIEFNIVYHKSWDALMPVVEKIAHIEIKDCPVISNGEDTFFDSYYLRTFGMVSAEEKDFMVRINRFPLHYSKSLIEATWQAVINFIQWYNTTKPLES